MDLIKKVLATLADAGQALAVLLALVLLATPVVSAAMAASHGDVGGAVQAVQGAANQFVSALGILALNKYLS